MEIREDINPRPRHKLPKPERAPGRLYTARELTSDEIGRIEAHFTQMLSERVILRPIVDESLIAGIKVEVCGFQWDGSISGTLSSLRERLKA